MEDELAKIYSALCDINLRLGEIQFMIACTKTQKIEKIEKTENKWWSLRYYKESIIINNYIDDDFKNFTKALGGKWLNSKKGWMFPKTKEDVITAALNERYPTWEMKDQRTEKEE
jgi:hypothetical protein